MHDEDALHPNFTLQQKLQHIYELRRETFGRVNFDDDSYYLKLLSAIGNPHKHLPPVIHVAGTNGKGSVIATLRAMLEAGGYRVHVYTSPHLLTFNERIYLAGDTISDEELEKTLDEMFEKNGDNPVTFFEFTTALAFLAFTRHPADIVLLETGMGGRLDCTNVVDTPLATAITTVSFDHMEFLGDTLAKIAAEKAGIIKPDVPCVTGPQQKESQDVFINKTNELGADLFSYNNDWSVKKAQQKLCFKFHDVETEYPLPNLLGDHQIYNAGTALAVLEMIQGTFPVSKNAKAEGLQNIHWPGRMEHKKNGKYIDLLPAGWELWFDCGHNVDGAKTVAAVLESWKLEATQPVHILLGMKENKDIEGVCEVLTPHCVSLVRFPVGTDISVQIKDIVASTPFTPSKILVCGSLYNYF